MIDLHGLKYKKWFSAVANEHLYLFLRTISSWTSCDSQSIDKPKIIFSHHAINSKVISAIIFFFPFHIIDCWCPCTVKFLATKTSSYPAVNIVFTCVCTRLLRPWIYDFRVLSFCFCRYPSTITWRFFVYASNSLSCNADNFFHKRRHSTWPARIIFTIFSFRWLKGLKNPWIPFICWARI